MKKLLIDTNIVLDLLAKREPFYKSASEIFSLADKGVLHLSINALTFANANYILTRLTSAQEAQAILRRFRVLVEVLPLNSKVIDLALNNSSFKDFEDALHYYSAIENDQEYIITRNLKDFKESIIPVMTADEFLISMSSK